MHAQARAQEVEELPPLADIDLPPPSPDSFPLYTPPPPSTHSLEAALDYRNIKAEDVPSMPKIHKMLKERMTAEITDQVPELDETELREFYTALIESGRHTSSEPQLPSLGAPEKLVRIGKEERSQVLQELAQRLLPPSQIASEGHAESSTAAVQRATDVQATQVEVLEALRAVALNAQSAVVGEADVPLGLVSGKEWDALFDDAIASRDPRRAEGIIALRDAHGQLPHEPYLPQLITAYAKKGLLEDVYRLEAGLREAGQHFSPIQHDLIIAHLLRRPSPTKAAIAHLKQYEPTVPAPQSSYNLVLTHLFTVSPTSHTRALAWDLFAHMRLRAHPEPVREIYSTMIAGCAAKSDPRPEHARDLWTEMTVDGGVIPEEKEYSAIIRALSSTKKFYLEAFDLFRQMLAKHHEAIYAPFGEQPTRLDTRWVPTVKTWKALLEGTMRAGDLGRARWVLSECVKLVHASRAIGLSVDGPDEEMMSSVFLSYAAWTPTVRRGQVPERGSASVSPDTESSPAVEAGKAEAEASDVEVAPQPGSSSTITMPASHADAIREADALFAQIMDPTEEGVFQPWNDVKPTPRLFNSYLCVHFAHAPSIEAAREVWTSTWSASPAAPNGWSYMLALERCARPNRNSGGTTNRNAALAWGDELWKSYLAFSEASRASSPQDIYALGLGARQVERVWRAMIRCKTLSNDLDGALQLLSAFHQRYPHQAILDGYAPFGVSGLDMRFSDPTTILEPDVPPHLLFVDVDVLHQRLVRDDQFKKVAHLKWIVTSYETSLQKRRKWRLRGVGEAREARKAKAARIAWEREQQQMLAEPKGISLQMRVMHA